MSKSYCLETCLRERLLFSFPFRREIFFFQFFFCKDLFRNFGAWRGSKDILTTQEWEIIKCLLRCNWEQDSLKFWKSLFLFCWLRKNIVFIVTKVRWTVVETPGPKGFLANSFERGCGTNRGGSVRLCLIVFVPSSLTQIQIWVDFHYPTTLLNRIQSFSWRTNCFLNQYIAFRWRNVQLNYRKISQLGVRGYIRCPLLPLCASMGEIQVIFVALHVCLAH